MNIKQIIIFLLLLSIITISINAAVNYIFFPGNDTAVIYNTVNNNGYFKLERVGLEKNTSMLTETINVSAYVNYNKADPVLKSKIKFADTTNIDVSETSDGGLHFKSTGTHLNNQKVEITDVDFKAKDKIKDGIIKGWYLADGSNIPVVVDIPVTKNGNKYSFNLPLSELCVGCFTGTATRIGSNQTNTTNFSLGQFDAADINSIALNITPEKTNNCSPYNTSTACENRTGLVSEWHADNNWNDTSGQNNNGTWYGNATANWTTGKYNNAGSFDGVDDYVEKTSFNSGISANSDFTMSTWIKPDTITTTHTVMVLWSGPSGTNQNVQVGINPTKAYINYYNEATEYAYSFSVGTWYNIIYVHGNSVDYYYVNGVLVGSAAKTLAIETTHTFRIGAYGNGGGWFDGIIDEVRVYNKALSLEEIKQQYLVGVQQLQARTNSNTTYSSNWNSSANNPLNIPFNSSDAARSSLNFLVPDNVTYDDGVTCYNCSAQMRFAATSTIFFTQNTSTEFEGSANGYYHYNTTLALNGNITNGSINLTISDATFLNSLFKGSPTFSTNNSNATLIYNHPYLNISLGVTNTSTFSYYVTIPYNNASTSTLINQSFTTAINATILSTASDVDGNTIYCYGTLDGVTLESCTSNDFGLKAVGIYTYFFNVTDRNGTIGGTYPWVNKTATITVDYSSPTPIIGIVTTGNFYINTTWINRSGTIITDSFNSTNGTVWINSSLPYRNTSLNAHGWQNLSIYSFNNTYGLNTSALINTTRVPNNAPVQNIIGNKSVYAGSWLNFTITSTDLDGDSLSYATNATKGTLTTNNFSWLTNISEAGNYTFKFNTTDNFSAVSNEENVSLSVLANLTLSSPTNLSTTNSTTITLRWIENPAHPQYNYQIATDYLFLNIVSSGSVIANLTTVDLTNNTQYYWRVKNATGPYTGWFSFTTPTAATTPGLLNITTLEEQNLTTLSDFTVQLYNATTVLTRTTTTGWVNFTAAEVTSSQYFINVIPNSTYARRAVLATSPANVTVFVPNAATATVDIISFYLMDYTNKFPWTTSYLVVTKNNSVIHSSYFDADAKVTVYLIRGQSYTITLYNGNNIKQWGNYISIGNANVQMVIMESGFNTSTANPYVQQITSSNSNITLTWSAVAGTLNLLNFSVYKSDMNNLVHNIVTTVENGQSEYIVTNTSDIYYVFAIVDTSSGRQELTKIIDYRSGTRIGGIAYTWNYGNYSVPLWVYTVFSLMAIILLAGGFGALHRGEGAIITAFAALFFAYKGWLSMYTGGIGMIVGLLLFAILYHLDSRRKGGY